MLEPHEGNVRVVTEFEEAWDYLNRTGELHLQTEREGKPFIAKATITGKGIHSGEKSIRFLKKRNGKRQEYARSYECCWGHYYNCNRTRIGMYCKALDNAIRFS